MSEALPATVALQLWRLDGSAPSLLAPDHVVAEEPLDIRVEGRTVAVIMRTPGHERELAAGFLLSEGVISTARDLFEISLCPGVGSSVVDVTLRQPDKVDFERLSRHILTPGSCGICGKTSIAAALERHPSIQVRDGISIKRQVLFSLPAKQREAQEGFACTGGSHAAALFDATGGLMDLKEDAGRHNAVDKISGAALLENRLPLDQSILLLSGRISFELVQKALAARIPVIAAVGAPSSLAVSTAEEAGITLCGFLRESRVNVYTHPGRIT